MGRAAALRAWRGQRSRVFSLLRVILTLKSEKTQISAPHGARSALVRDTNLTVTAIAKKLSLCHDNGHIFFGSSSVDLYCEILHNTAEL